MINRKTPVLLFYLVITFFSIGIASAQQQTLKGKVVNKDKLPVEFVHATLLKNDTVFVEGMATDSLGTFLFKAEKGNYRLILEQFDAEYFNQHLELTQDIDLGEIEIDESVVLEGITITAMRSLVSHSGDKLIFDIENSPFSKGNSGMEVLQKSPKLSIGSQGNILLQNKDVTILVNGRKLNLQGSSLTNYISNLNSEDIKRIEIQDISASNQDASTNGGSINIVLKNQPIGFRLIGKGYYLYRGENVDGYYASANLNYGTQKWNFYSTIDYTNALDKGNSRGFFNYEDGRSMSQQSTFNQSSDYLAIRAGSIFSPNEKNEIGIEGYYNSSNSQNNLINSLIVKSEINEEEKSTNKSITSADNDLWFFTGYYTIRLDTLGSNVRFTADIGNAKNSPTNDVISSYENPALNSQYFNLSNSKSRYLTTQVDYTKLYQNNWEFSIGAKFNSIFRENDLIGKITSQNSTGLIIEQLDFNNRESIYAAYFSLSKSWGNHYLKGGLRYEYTDVKGINKIDQTDIKQSYKRSFPTLYYKYKIDNKRAFSIAYRSGIGRPSFHDINPFVIKQNDYLYLLGNPDLRPQYNDNFYADYTFGSNTLSAYAELTSKMIHNVYYEKDDMIYYQALNYGNAQGYGINHAYNSNINTWLYLSINSGMFYNRFKPVAINSIDGFALYSNLFANVKLSKNWMVEIIQNYTTPSKYRNVDMAYRYNLDAGVQKTFLNGKLIAKVKVFDIFNTVRDKNISHYEMFTYDFYQKRKSRSVIFFLQFNIDNKKSLRDKKVSSDNENRNRL